MATIRVDQIDWYPTRILSLEPCKLRSVLSHWVNLWSEVISLDISFSLFCFLLHYSTRSFLLSICKRVFQQFLFPSLSRSHMFEVLYPLVWNIVPYLPWYWFWKFFQCWPQHSQCHWKGTTWPPWTEVTLLCKNFLQGGELLSLFIATTPCHHYFHS